MGVGRLRLLGVGRLGLVDPLCGRGTSQVHEKMGGMASAPKAHNWVTETYPLCLHRPLYLSRQLTPQQGSSSVVWGDRVQTVRLLHSPRLLLYGGVCTVGE